MADEIEMLDDGPVNEMRGESEVTIVLPESATLVKDRYLNMSKVDALKLIANMAVQVALNG